MTAVFPLGAAYLPGDHVVLRVFEARFRRMFDDLASSRLDSFVTVLIERGHEVGGGDRRFEHGVTVRVTSVSESDGVLVVEGVAGEPVRVVEWEPDSPYPSASVETSGWEEMSLQGRRDAASAVTLLAQSVRVLLARHGVAGPDNPHPHMSMLASVASGHWHDADPRQDEIERAFWAVARCVPCGPLDRHRFLCETTGPGAIRLLRSVTEHTDEILAFGSRDER